MKIPVIIPASNLKKDAAAYIKYLIENGTDDIIIADEKTGALSSDFAGEAGNMPQVKIVSHKRKTGRGAALKAAFRFLEENRTDAAGAVVFTGNELYGADTLKSVMDAFSPDKVIFAGMERNGGSSFKMRATSLIYRFAIGIHLSDTSAALRLIPAKYFDFFAKLPGKARGYETRMLTGLMNEKIPYEEILIKPSGCVWEGSAGALPGQTFLNYTIVLAYFFKFALSSVSSYFIDMGVYALLLYLLKGVLGTGSQVFVCTAASRVISSLFNYIINRKTVFKSTDGMAGAAARYYIIAAAKLGASYALIYLFTELLKITGFAQLIIKALVDLILFLFSFQIQKNWVFKHKNI